MIKPYDTSIYRPLKGWEIRTKGFKYFRRMSSGLITQQARNVFSDIELVQGLYRKNQRGEIFASIDTDLNEYILHKTRHSDKTLKNFKYV